MKNFVNFSGDAGLQSPRGDVILFWIGEINFFAKKFGGFKNML